MSIRSDGGSTSMATACSRSTRIKDTRITQINRKMPHVAFTINVEESSTTQDQKQLTTKYTVYYFSPKDGALRNVESFTDTHVRVGPLISRQPAESSRMKTGPCWCGTPHLHQS